MDQSDIEKIRNLLTLKGVQLEPEIEEKIIEEEINYQSFCLLEDLDLKNLGFRLGPRKRILLKNESRINDLDERFTNEIPPNAGSELIDDSSNELITRNPINRNSLFEEQPRRSDSINKDERWIQSAIRVPIEGAPIQLISQMDGKLSINPEAFDIIRSLNGNIAICSVVGPYRSGKSFILNQLLDRQRGFELGSTTESCTRGIWMWNRPIKHKNDNGEFNLIIMDTEGLGSTDVAQEHDNRIFVLSLLLSSMFVYNTKNVIDRDAIKKLAIMANLAEHIDSRANSQNQSMASSNQNKLSLPDFVWVVRDFFLINAHSTPNAYLNNALELEKNRNDESINQANFIRESIKNSFKSLTCHLIPKPIESGLNGWSHDQTLQNLQDVEWDQLTQDFRDKMSQLCKDVKNNISCKSLFSTPLSAPAYAKYIECVVEQLNGNKKVALMDSAISGIQYASNISFQEAIQLYENKMGSLLKDYPLPKRWNTLKKEHQKAYQESLNHLQRNLNGQNSITQPYIEQLSKLICDYEIDQNNNSTKIVGGRWSTLREANIKAIRKYYKSQLDNLWDEWIVKKYFGDHDNNRDMNLGKNFEDSLKYMLKVYESNQEYGDGPEKSEAYVEWYNEKQIGTLINNTRELGEQVKRRIEQEQLAAGERARVERLEKEKSDGEERLRADLEQINQQMKELQIRNEYLARELMQKQVEYENSQEDIKRAFQTSLDEMKKNIKKYEILYKEAKQANMGGDFELIGRSLGRALDRFAPHLNFVRQFFQ